MGGEKGANTNGQAISKRGEGWWVAIISRSGCRIVATLRIQNMHCEFVSF